MPDDASSADALKRQLNDLDDRLDELVASIDPEAPETHAAVYAEIETIQDQMEALKARAKLAGQSLH